MTVTGFFTRLCAKMPKYSTIICNVYNYGTFFTMIIFSRSVKPMNQQNDHPDHTVVQDLSNLLYGIKENILGKRFNGILDAKQCLYRKNRRLAP